MSYKRSFLYYSRLSVSEGLDKEANELEMNLRCFDQDIFQKCNYCSHVFAIKKTLKMTKKLAMPNLNV